MHSLHLLNTLLSAKHFTSSLLHLEAHPVKWVYNGEIRCPRSQSMRQNLCLKSESLTLEPDSFYNSPVHDLAEK